MSCFEGVIVLTQWDFAADLGGLLALVEHGAGPRTMSSMVQEVDVIVQRSRTDDPAGLERWFNDNAETLIGQQILVASVHAQRSPAIELPRVVRAWSAQTEDPTPAAAVAWLKEEYPGLLRAWLLCRVEDLIADEIARS